MSRMLNAILPAILLISALTLSACATKPEAVPAAEPPPVETVQEPAAPEPEPEAEAVAAPAPVEVVEESSFAPAPAPEPIAPKPRKRVAKRSPPPMMSPAPVIAEAPIAEPEAPAVSPDEFKPPVTVAPVKQEIQEEGFLKKYWLWLLVGLTAVIAGIVVWWRRGGGVED